MAETSEASVTSVFKTKHMKLFKYITLFTAVATMFTACEDEDNVVFDPSSVTPCTLTAPAKITITAESAVADEFEFSWTKAEFGFDAAPTYRLEVDLQGNEFANAQTLGQSNALKTAVPAAKINQTLMTLLKKYEGVNIEEANQYEMRILAEISDQVYSTSEPVLVTIQGFAGAVEYSKCYMIGDFSDWKFESANTQYLFDFANNGIYRGVVFFNGKAANGFKITDGPNWDGGNFGSPEQSEDAEAPSIDIKNDGGSKDIKCYSKNYYCFAFNKEKLILDVELSFNTLGVVGTINNWGDNTPDIPMEFNVADQTFSAIVTTTAEDKIKFRSDNDWGVNFGGADGLLKQGGDDIVLGEGTWNIIVDINNPEKLTYTVEKAVALDPALIVAPAIETALEAETTMSRSSSFDLSWSAVDFGRQEAASVSYSVRASLTEDFADYVELASVKETTTKISGADLVDNFTTAEEGATIYLKVVANVNGITTPFDSNVISSEFTILNAVELPTVMYITGTIDGWGWTGIELTPINHWGANSAGTFWTIQYFPADTKIKFNNTKEWDGGQFGTEAVKENEYTTSDGDGNVVFSEAGYYQIAVRVSYTDDTQQETKKEINVSKPELYTIGDCVGSWDTPVAFTFDEENSVFKSAAIAADGNIRMYAKVLNCDWWSSEFNIYDGKIVLRGDGDDQAEVAATAGQVITLDFANMTGSIE